MDAHKMGCNPSVIFYPTTTQVLWDPVDVTYVDDQIIVVSKPCSIPVHPVGRYKVHSLLSEICAYVKALNLVH